MFGKFLSYSFKKNKLKSNGTKTCQGNDSRIGTIFENLMYKWPLQLSYSKEWIARCPKKIMFWLDGYLNISKLLFAIVDNMKLWLLL